MPRRTPLIASLSVAAAAVVLSSPSSSCSAFHVSSRNPTSRAFRPAAVTALNSHGVRHSPLEDSPWESEPSYFDRLREAAKDPDTFEAFVAANSNGNAENTNRPGEAASRPPVGSEQEDEAPKPKKTGGYKRIEEWDEELRSKQDGSGMTWEEKVQFDGMRHGNGMRQNDILVHHLHSF